MKKVDFSKLVSGAIFVQELVVASPASINEISFADRSSIFRPLDDLIDALEGLDCTASLASVRALRKAIENASDGPPARGFNTPSHSLTGLPLHIYRRNAALVVDRIVDEINGRTAFTLSAREAHMYDQPEPLFGCAVNDRFPSAAYDISEAGKCRALGRWTACVMHLMRALEPSLAALQNAVQVAIPKENWGDIINQIEAKIRSDGTKHVDHQWNMEAVSYFRVIKNAFRNYAMHGRDIYDEERAAAIFESVRSFMIHLADRLKE